MALTREHGPHGHSAHAHDETKLIDTGHGVIALSVFEDGAPPQFRVHFKGTDGRDLPPPTDQTLSVETIRDDGARQRFAFERKGEFLEATSILPEPHQFKAALTLDHHGHAHTHHIVFTEHDHGHDHDHAHDQ